jgi:hypothetical protein
MRETIETASIFFRLLVLNRSQDDIRHVLNVTKLSHRLPTVLRKAPLNLFGCQNITAFPMAIAQTIIDLHVAVVLKLVGR